MARHQVVSITDDFDGSEGATGIRFGLDDRWFSVDLSPEHEKELRDFLARFVAVAAAVPVHPVVEPASAPIRNPHDVRKWLWANGIKISGRGRIPKVYLTMYDQQKIDPAYIAIEG